jgi:hypothetical protein
MGTALDRIPAGRSHRKERLDETGASWSECVVDASRNGVKRPGNLGVRFRGTVAGPEQVLIEAFLQVAKTPLGPGRRLTVFAQPAIETGFPDLVAVVWRSKTARSWVAERERLRAMDLRLLHLLATNGAIDLLFLRKVFQRGLHGMLSRLEEAGAVAIGKSKCRAQSSSQIFAVERIIAVEAKVSATQRALEQAGANIWYSSESHALLPTPRTCERLRVGASALGVGVMGFDHNGLAQVHEASVRAVPLSYGSWLFNEWTWRIAREQGAI